MNTIKMYMYHTHTYICAYMYMYVYVTCFYMFLILGRDCLYMFNNVTLYIDPNTGTTNISHTHICHMWVGFRLSSTTVICVIYDKPTYGFCMQVILKISPRDFWRGHSD